MSLSQSVILGIDPGLATIGYGVVKFDYDTPHLLDYGIISTPAKTPIAERLLQISSELDTILTRFTPDQVAIEDLFFCTNVKTAIKLRLDGAYIPSFNKNFNQAIECL